MNFHHFIHPLTSLPSAKSDSHQTEHALLQLKGYCGFKIGENNRLVERKGKRQAAPSDVSFWHNGKISGSVWWWGGEGVVRGGCDLAPVLCGGQAGCNLHSDHLREQQEKKPLPPSRKLPFPCGRECQLSYKNAFIAIARPHDWHSLRFAPTRCV